MDNGILHSIDIKSEDFVVIIALQNLQTFIMLGYTVIQKYHFNLQASFVWALCVGTLLFVYSLISFVIIRTFVYSKRDIGKYVLEALYVTSIIVTCTLSVINDSFVIPNMQLLFFAFSLTGYAYYNLVILIFCSVLLGILIQYNIHINGYELYMYTPLSAILLSYFLQIMGGNILYFRMYELCSIIVLSKKNPCKYIVASKEVSLLERQIFRSLLNPYISSQSQDTSKLLSTSSMTMKRQKTLMMQNAPSNIVSSNSIAQYEHNKTAENKESQFDKVDDTNQNDINNDNYIHSINNGCNRNKSFSKNVSDSNNPNKFAYYEDDKSEEDKRNTHETDEQKTRRYSDEQNILIKDPLKNETSITQYETDENVIRNKVSHDFFLNGKQKNNTINKKNKNYREQDEQGKHDEMGCTFQNDEYDDIIDYTQMEFLASSGSHHLKRRTKKKEKNNTDVVVCNLDILFEGEGTHAHEYMEDVLEGGSITTNEEGQREKTENSVEGDNNEIKKKEPLTCQEVVTVTNKSSAASEESIGTSCSNGCDKNLETYDNKSYKDKETNDVAIFIPDVKYSRRFKSNLLHESSIMNDKSDTKFIGKKKFFSGMDQNSYCMHKELQKEKIVGNRKLFVNRPNKNNSRQHVLKEQDLSDANNRTERIQQTNVTSKHNEGSCQSNTVFYKKYFFQNLMRPSSSQIREIKSRRNKKNIEKEKAIKADIYATYSETNALRHNKREETTELLNRHKSNNALMRCASNRSQRFFSHFSFKKDKTEIGDADNNHAFPMSNDENEESKEREGIRNKYWTKSLTRYPNGMFKKDINFVKQNNSFRGFFLKNIKDETFVVETTNENTGKTVAKKQKGFLFRKNSSNSYSKSHMNLFSAVNTNEVINDKQDDKTMANITENNTNAANNGKMNYRNRSSCTNSTNSAASSKNGSNNSRHTNDDNNNNNNKVDSARGSNTYNRDQRNKIPSDSTEQSKLRKFNLKKKSNTFTNHMNSGKKAKLFGSNYFHKFSNYGNKANGSNSSRKLDKKHLCRRHDDMLDKIIILDISSQQKRSRKRSYKEDFYFQRKKQIDSNPFKKKEHNYFFLNIPTLNFLFFLFPRIVKTISILSKKIFDDLKKKKKVMQNAAWKNSIFIPERDPLGSFKNTKLEKWYITWMNEFNKRIILKTVYIYIYLITYIMILDFVTFLRLYKSVAQTNSHFTSANYIHYFIFKLFVNISMYAGIYFSSFRNKTNETFDTRNYYIAIVVLCLIELITRSTDIYIALSSLNLFHSPYYVYVHIHILIIQTAMFLIVRYPTQYLLYFIYLTTFTIIYWTCSLHKSFIEYLFITTCILFTIINAYILCSRTLEINRRILFCKYELPYILYLKEIVHILNKS